MWPSKAFGVLLHSLLSTSIHWNACDSIARTLIGQCQDHRMPWHGSFMRPPIHVDKLLFPTYTARPIKTAALQAGWQAGPILVIPHFWVSSHLNADMSDVKLFYIPQAPYNPVSWYIKLRRKGACYEIASNHCIHWYITEKNKGVGERKLFIAPRV